jgi:hypothetical protein
MKTWCGRAGEKGSPGLTNFRHLSLPGSISVTNNPGYLKIEKREFWIIQQRQVYIGPALFYYLRNKPDLRSQSHNSAELG